MKILAFRTLPVLLLLATAATGTGLARDLTFEERVAAQEAIERVYYSHQIGATKPFEEAVPREVLEGKVGKYLQQTVALEAYWKTGVTDESLQRELERMARGTRLPDRLRELFAALNDDPFVIKECLARATLVDRLTRNFYAFDPTLHAQALQRAEEIHRQLEAGELNPWSDHPDRTVVVLAEGKAEAVEPRAREREAGLMEEGRPARHLLSPENFRKERARWPEAPGRVAPLAEEREAFVIRIVLSDAPGESRVASYVVRKQAWDLWWETAKEDLLIEQVAAVASNEGSLPLPAGRAAAALRISSSTADAVPDPLTADDLPCTDDTWDNGVLDDMPTPRNDHTAVWTGNMMVVWGGFGDGGYVNTGGRYDPATDSWTATSTLGAPSPRRDQAAVWTGSLMVIWGGNDGTTLNTGGRYDPATDSWTPTSALAAPSARREHTAVWTGSVMVVWGGYGDTYLNTGGRYDPSADSWTATSTVGAPSARYGYTAVWTGSLMVVWGGYDGAHLNTGGRYDPATDSWTATSTLGAPSVRYRHSAVWTGSLMVAWGGYGNTVPYYLNTGGRYDPATDTWTATSTLVAPSARAYHSAIWTGSRMVVWGGYDGTQRNTGGRYDPATDTWTATSTLGAPSARYVHTAVWTGNLMLIWGGSGVVSYNTGARYDPVTDSWTATSTSTLGAPSARYVHTAVWTGSLMVIWGGHDGSNYLNTGGRYEPATDSWTVTSTLGAPPARNYHSAIWTGSVMAVWGGHNDSTSLNTGGRYNPVTDTWSATSTAGAPSARYMHTAVWTGSLMVVWGGRDDFTSFYTGGRYDPVADTWTQTSILGMPAARRDHTAVWTGSVMVAWGGYDGSNYLNTGGRYDPGTDSWTPTSTLGAPSGRAGHTVVWTGSLMVAWGGYGGAHLNTGGRYDPGTDSWTATSTLAAPSGRYRHSVVWTGRLMVVWGGYDGTYLDTGGRYDPATDSWTATSTLGAPSARDYHTAIWTASLMVVWGGYDGAYLNTGGRYVLDTAVDDDGDGFTECMGDCNDGASTIYPGAPQICDGVNNDCNYPGWPTLAGTNDGDDDGDTFTECEDDCDDADMATYPDAVETNDGKDNQCPGDPGFGIIDEISGALAFRNPAAPNEISWPAQPGATDYEVIRASSPLFPPVCAGLTTQIPSWSDPEIPPTGGVFYYLVRSIAPYVGSWGVKSSGVERTGLCGVE